MALSLRQLRLPSTSSSSFFPSDAHRLTEFPDNRLNWHEWLEEYGVPLWVATVTVVVNVIETTSMEVFTLRFEDLKQNTTEALAPLMDFLGTFYQRRCGLGRRWP